MLKILLFDMDDVLLEAHGYHRALQDTVLFIARSLGYENANLTPDDIAAFEASGVTSEWDSSAICAVLMLEKIWSIDPGRELPTNISQSPATPLDIKPPDFHRFAVALGKAGLKSLRPRERAERIMISDTSHLTASQKNMILEILHNARQIDGSLTHRAFQELILGSEEFNQTYNLDPFFDTDSYLNKYDLPSLLPAQRALLVDWLQLSKHRGVILTNRPSRAPRGYFCTPEAEIGARLVGLERLPIAGFGGLTWLSHIRGQDQESYIKPSPVHALAALRLALGDSQEEALQSAAALAEDNQQDTSWQKLQDAQVTIFEDTTGGLESLIQASDRLQAADIHLETQLFGISSNQKKRTSLESTGAHLSPTLPDALKAARIFP
jgi:hypothetical protein